MTVFFTRCCRRLELRCAFIALWLGMAAAPPVHAQGIEIRKASVTIAEDAYVLDAQFDIALTHTLEDVLNKGVPLYFQLEFELVRSRWYWFNDRVSSWQQQHRLSYNALTRQYRLGVGNLSTIIRCTTPAFDLCGDVHPYADPRRGVVDSRLILFSRRYYLEKIVGLYQEMNDSAGEYAEHRLYQLVRRNPQTKVIPRLPCEPKWIGVSGSTGEQYDSVKKRIYYPFKVMRRKFDTVLGLPDLARIRGA